MELLARFDEGQNIEYADILQRAGVRVIDGVAGLKIHCKLILVERRERGGTRGETVRCDIQTLTAMFYGYKRPTYLKRVERLQANDTAVRILEDIIPIEQPYFSDYF